MKKNKKIILSSIFILSALLLAEDMATDIMSGSSISHLMEEIIVMVLLCIGIIFIWKDSIELKANLTRTQKELESAKKESLQWIDKNKTLIKGLGAAIDIQMEEWHLTASEKEIALLLMKGMSMKEIADIRNTAERTVRQQSLAIYSKSGLSGRAELSAYFLEDILGPSQKEL